MIVDASALLAVLFREADAARFAAATGEPLLFKGDDFSQTDVKPALRD